MARSVDVSNLEDQFKEMSQKRDGTLRREIYVAVENKCPELSRSFRRDMNRRFSSSFSAFSVSDSSFRPGRRYSCLGTDDYNSFRHSHPLLSKSSGRSSTYDRCFLSSSAGFGQSSSARSLRYPGAFDEMRDNSFLHRSNVRKDENDDDDTYSRTRWCPQATRGGFHRDVLDDRDLLPTSPRGARPSDCRWVGDGSGCSGAVRDIPSPSHLLSQVRPSPLFLDLVQDVAARRNVCVPPIPPEVVIAFDSFVSRGTVVLKFIPNGAPHERFFIIKFLGKRTLHKNPEPVLCWYSSPRSWAVRQYFLLSDLVDVIDGWKGHPSVTKRMVEHGLIKCSPVNFRVNYVRPEFILQFHFRHFTRAEERIAVKFMNKESYVAWRIVTHFFSKIGSG